MWFLAAAYMIIVVGVFIKRHNNIIKNREGEIFIPLFSKYVLHGEVRRWYDKLNANKRITNQDIDYWNYQIRTLGKHWKRIYLVIFFKSIFFPLVIICQVIAFIINKAYEYKEHLDTYTFNPLSKFELEYNPPPKIETRGESPSYREEPDKKEVLGTDYGQEKS